MVEAAAASFTQTDAAQRPNLLRAVVHLRHDDGYQRLFGIDSATREELEGTGYLTSTRVWEWVAEHQCAVSIDVMLGLVRAYGLDTKETELTASSLSGMMPGVETRQRLLGRDASHVHVIPLRTMSGRIMGLIALEARCKGAAKRIDIWERCREMLEVLAGLAAPYLEALPPRTARTAPTSDVLLPVIGRTTAGIVEVLRVFAAQEDTLLISGPTGVGKSRIACWCHEHSSRHERRFETLDLSTVPEELQLAELFGWKRGAFTGAVKDSPGAISRAAGGTLFLDEMQNLSSKAQAGLLRVLEDRVYRPLGDEAGDKLADVRFIIGTNADLKAAVRAGKFREDLYYRVHVLPVRLPPLSERLDEVPLWAEYMLTRRHRGGGQGGAARFDRDALQSLSGCSWPGNLRQLDNLVRRVYALALWERREATGDVVVGKRHVERALQYDGETKGGALVASFWLAAKQFVQEAQRREDESKPKLTLEMMDVIRGLGLGAAVLHCGDRDEAFRLLGQEQMLKTRNHHRAYRREIERVSEFVKLVGGDVEDDLNALLNAPEDHG